MLKLINAPINGSIDAPRYIPVQIGMENVLVANGWSFLDPDESEPISAFDLDSANKEGQYKPKWGHDDAIMDESTIIISSLGYTLQHDPFEVIVKASQNEGLTPQAKKVLLEGGTDPPHIKATNNGYEFSAKTCTFPEGNLFAPSDLCRFLLLQICHLRFCRLLEDGSHSFDPSQRIMFG
jgi:hypothetical protein